MSCINHRHDLIWNSAEHSRLKLRKYLRQTFPILPSLWLGVSESLGRLWETELNKTPLVLTMWCRRLYFLFHYFPYFLLSSIYTHRSNKFFSDLHGLPFIIINKFRITHLSFISFATHNAPFHLPFTLSFSSFHSPPSITSSNQPNLANYECEWQPLPRDLPIVSSWLL